MWSDWLVVCDYSFSLSALWSPLSVTTVLLAFHLPWTWGLSSQLLQQSAATAPYLRRRVVCLPAAPDLQPRLAPLSHARAPSQPPKLKTRLDQISRSVVSDSLRPHELQHARPPCLSPTPGVHSDSCPSSQWCHPAISSSVVPFSSCP